MGEYAAGLAAVPIPPASPGDYIFGVACFFMYIDAYIYTLVFSI
jgi:hypothetical protein